MAVNKTSATSKRRRRRMIAAVVCLALAGGGIAAAIVVRKPATTAATTAPSIFKTATVKRGSLTTTENVDGVVQLSATLTVLHRIEGQTSSSATASSSSSSNNASNNAASNSANNSSNSGGGATTASSTPLPVNSAAALIDCTTGTTTTTSAPTPTTATTDTVPGDTTPSTPGTDSATTTSTTIPASTTTTPPCDTTTTAPTPTTTTPLAPSTSTPPDTTVPASGGAARPRSFGAPSGSTSGGAAPSSGSTARITQTITSIIGVNTAIQQGDVLYTVDGSPVVALDGALPAWRSLSTASTDGADVAQLEASLVALGYDPAQKVTVDNHFDTATRTMVKAWQQGLGITATGTVPLGSVVFLPAATTVSTVDPVVGDTVSDGDAVMTLATPTQEVLIDVPAGDESQVVPGLAVTIGQVDGSVTRLRSANRNGTVVVEAIIAPAAPIAAAGNGSAVKVGLTLQDNSGALILPAAALVSRLDGTYAVEAQEADGSTKWLTVELLGVSGGNIAISGDGVSEGTTVLVPA